MRLGFAVKSLVRPELKSHDSRRWQNDPHLTVSLAYLRDIFRYLLSARIGMYRLASELAPYLTHPGLPQFHDQLLDAGAELAEIGRLARGGGLRLSFHPSQHVVLNAPDADLVARSSADVTVQATILDMMGLGQEAVVVLHVGGVYDSIAAARERFVRNALALPPHVLRRVVLENDDARFCVSDILWIHEQTRLPLVFDYLHHRLHNPEGLGMREALAACLDTWPADVRPKIHFSSPRTEWRVGPMRNGSMPVVTRPRWAFHSDYVNPFEFVDLMRTSEGLRRFDVMLEVRAKDLALVQLREDLARFAPELANELEPVAG